MNMCMKVVIVCLAWVILAVELGIILSCARTPDPGVAAPDSVKHAKKLGAARPSLVCVEGHEYYEFYNHTSHGDVYCYALKVTDDGKPIQCVMEETKQ